MPFVCKKCGKELQAHSEVVSRFGWVLCPACDDAWGKPEAAAPTVMPCGHVYMLRSGPHYKIGKTRDLNGRLDQIKLQLPWPVEVVHTIETDDPDGIESYWHKRFSEKRENGEWFNLTRDDVAIFMWRTRM